MSLYINPHHHQEIYKSNNMIQEPNQGFFIKNHTEEMVKEQKQVNDSLSKSLNELKEIYKQQEKRWSQYDNENVRQKAVENKVLDQLQKIDSSYENLDYTVQSQQINQNELMDELKNVSIIQENIQKQLKEYSKLSEEWNKQLTDHMEFQSELSEQIKDQDKNQQEIVKRLNNQEALTQKITRQLEHLRTILFERTSHLSDKMEDISSFVLQSLKKEYLDSGFYIQQKQKEKEVSHK
ncbi:hypothetical protein [Oceanobacillus senegalensis]|uniref:hypothetical protein n=1 Tax=Oceanobacillus senegalensis TaxID=1936063 RepID=UPI000A307FCB|nr:hypothetical protein [Oceanobacillus senegalensis]